MRIIMENVGAGESHGCPFRHHEGKILRKELEKGIKPAELDAIMKKVNEGHFQVFNHCQSVRMSLPFDREIISFISILNLDSYYMKLVEAKEVISRCVIENLKSR